MADSGCNKSRSLAFRDAVVLALNEAGVTAARRPELTGAASPALRLMLDSGAIDCDPWTLHVHRQRTHDFSASLDAVASRAEAEGRSLFASIHHRKSHLVEEAYVVMPLSVFAEAFPCSRG